MAAVEIEWKEPPIDAFENNYKGRTVAALKQRAGQWARLKKDLSSTSAKNLWEQMGCKVVMHRTNPGATPARYDLYAQWPLPAAKPAPAPPSGRALVPPPSGPRPTDALARMRADREARGVPPEGLPPGSMVPGR